MLKSVEYHIKSVLTNCCLIVALFVLALVPLSGQDAEGTERIKEQAEAGRADMQAVLSLLYRVGGASIEKNAELALHWAQKASEQDNPDGHLIVSLMLNEGDVIATDTARSEQLQKRAAEQGHPLAMLDYTGISNTDPHKALAMKALGIRRLEGLNPQMAIKQLVEYYAVLAKISIEERKKIEEITAELDKSIPQCIPLLGTTHKPGEPAFEAKQIEKYLEDVLPMVEQSAAATFKTRPTIRLASRCEVIDSLSRDLIPQLARQLPNHSELQIYVNARIMAISMGVTLLGKYGFHDKVLYLLPENLFPIMDKARIARSNTEGLLKMIMAHELTHALQDQEVDLIETIGNRPDDEAATAFNAIIEGHAVFVQDSVGTSLGYDKEILEFARLLTAGKVEEQNTLDDLVARQQEAMFEQIYLGGRKFIEYIYLTYGRARIWAVYRSLPLQASVIADPKSYSFTLNKAAKDLFKFLTGIEKHFGSNKWQINQIRQNTMVLKTAFTGLPTERIDKVMTKVEGSHLITLVSQSPSAMTAVNVITCKDPGTAHDVLDMSEDIFIDGGRF